MRHHRARLSAAVIIGLTASLATISLTGQSQTPRDVEAAKEAERKLILSVAEGLKKREAAMALPTNVKDWKPGRTPWGDPDLQGVWSSDDTSGIPMQRPVDLGTNLYQSNEQWAARQKKPVTATPVNSNLVMEGTDMTVEQMIKSTRRGLLVSFFWYIRAVDQPTLLNTGMTRDGLFLIENGEIVGPVQNFRWNMSPIVGFNNVTAIGKSVPMHTGESYDGGGTALVPAVRMEDFYMTSVSPAV